MKNNKALAFLFLVFAVLFSYWTYQQVRFYIEQKEKKSFENLPDTSSTQTENVQNEQSEKERAEVEKPEETDKQNEGINLKENPKTKNVKWVANDYKKGDITEKSYTVKYGDTLWEIAEGAYGNGALWVNILKANSQNIKFLPNGQQALIFPGQVLQIP